MSYAPTSLGYTLIIKTPVGDQKISIPLRSLAAKATDEALAVAWPKVESRVMTLLPKLLNTAAAQVKKEVPGFIDMAVYRLKPTLHKEEQKILKKIDAKAKEILNEATKRALIVTGFLSVVIVGSALLVSRR